jgi:hypothetical protein
MLFYNLLKDFLRLTFSTLKHFDPKYQVDIKAYVDMANVGLKQIDKGKFEWRLKKEMWNHFKELATALHRNGRGDINI